MGNLTNDLIQKANGATQDFKSKVQGAEGQIEKMSHSAGQTIGEMTARVSDTASEYARTGREYVKDNPVKGIAMAAGIGALIGSLITLALRRRD